MPTNGLRRCSLLTAIGTMAALSAVSGWSPAASAPAYTVQSLHFKVQVGPDKSKTCDVVGDLYMPSTASATSRVPAILTTNGFGGSAADQTPFAQKYAALGYAVLSYSGLGFGGSGCKITLDDPDFDGQAGSQLVSFLGGAGGIGFTDATHTTAATPVDFVVRDKVDHSGKKRTDDPRVGMWGGSYGGQVQFAVASIDARVDALNPQITWNDLTYSLGPNNTGQTKGVSTAVPGATKVTWAAAFSAVGIFDGVQYAQNDPQRLIGCPNFADFVCPALVTGGATGYLQPDAVTALRHASVANYMSQIKIPVLLDQGEMDTLFNLNESVATYQALKKQGTPVKLMWRYNGHSGGVPSAEGAAYEATRIQSWFDHYLKGTSASTGPEFAYYQDWDGKVGTASTYAVGKAKKLYLSDKGLVDSTAGIRPGTQSFVTTAAGAPTTLGELDAVGGQVGVTLPLPDVNLPGTFASWTGDPLAKATTVVGSPELDVTLSAPTAAITQAAGPAGQLVVFAKVYDVDAVGKASLINGLVAPVRVPDVTKPLHVTLPAFAHRFAPGHRIAVYLVGGDANYRAGTVAAPVSVVTGSTAQRLTLPVVN
ncbi:MAG: prolyl oligopeptidase family serine peptidase [Actinomycetota bacterium]|nr:prolyl oligopeptidase family serine peptidase [Actinomycetota bacterium]